MEKRNGFIIVDGIRSNKNIEMKIFLECISPGLDWRFSLLTPTITRVWQVITKYTSTPMVNDSERAVTNEGDTLL